jgi:hypothetical protein
MFDSGSPSSGNNPARRYRSNGGFGEMRTRTLARAGRPQRREPQRRANRALTFVGIVLQYLFAGLSFWSSDLATQKPFLRNSRFDIAAPRPVSSRKPCDAQNRSSAIGGADGLSCIERLPSLCTAHRNFSNSLLISLFSGNLRRTKMRTCWKLGTPTLPSPASGRKRGEGRVGVRLAAIPRRELLLIALIGACDAAI